MTTQTRTAGTSSSSFGAALSAMGASASAFVRSLLDAASAQRIPLAGYDAPVGAYAAAQGRDYVIETAAQAVFTRSAATVTPLKAPSAAPSPAAPSPTRDASALAA